MSSEGEDAPGLFQVLSYFKVFPGCISLFIIVTDYLPKARELDKNIKIDLD